MAVVQFDFAALPRVSRAEIAARAQLRSARAALAEAPIARALEAIAGAPVSLAVTRALPFHRADAEANVLGVAFAPADDASRVFLVEGEAPLARELVGRALKHPPTLVADPARPGGPDLRGAFAAVVLAALRSSGTAMRIAEDAVPPANAITAFLAVTIAGAAFSARVTFAPVPLVPGVAELDRLGDAPIALQIVATSVLAARADIEALAPGDVLMPAPGFLREWLVALVAPGEERGIAARVALGTEVVLRTEPSASHSWDPSMATEDKDNAALDVALEAPVVVRIELGSVQMKAREWAALGDGDVVTTGVKIGAPAVLRIGGVEVARGEIVNVDGEYGVRILGTSKR